MFYAILLLFLFTVTGIALFYFFRSNELNSRLRQATELWQQKEEAYTSELHKLEKIRHIPNVIERVRRSKEEVDAKLAEAGRRAEEIVQAAVLDAQRQCRRLREEGEQQLAQAQEVSRAVRSQAQLVLDEARKEAQEMRSQSQSALGDAQKEARELASKARKDAKEKREGAESAMNEAITYALEIRRKAERRAEEIAGEAYEAKGRLKDYEALAAALQNRITKYEGVDVPPPVHRLDELAEEFGFSKAGEKLRLARERTRLMQQNGTAATCGYAEGWKRDHALKFVLSTFDGKVDTILSRIKPGNQAKLIQEIKDSYALINKDGEVYKNARIEDEYLDSRLDEARWAVAVHKLKETAREEQRAIREQIREEQRARKEIEKAMKQAAREEELVNKAIEKIRRQFEEAKGAVKARLEAQLEELNVKLAEAEERGRKAISMAQQTKKGHVYIISNIGSFGEDVYKIGLTRRLDPTERVRELGDASVPFPFDVHALIASDDAPALETALHRRFLDRQVNKINRRKEFFKVSLSELRRMTEELGIEAAWTLAAEASQFRETLALEQAMKDDAGLRRKWLEEQATFNFGDESPEEIEEELEEVGA
jgi:hypothetical protein